MTPLNETYKVARTCMVCGDNEELAVTKREVAFELVDINEALGQTCKMCSSTFFTTAYQQLDLDVDLLKEWATNTDLYLKPQDEELFLADEPYVNMILEVLDTTLILDHKRDLLLDALCVIVYDNSNSDNSQRDEQLRKRVVDELNKKQDMLKLADKWIMDYIKVVVYPQLGFGSQNAV
jgi:hypothetical protein